MTSETGESVVDSFNTVLKDFFIGKDPTRIHLLNDKIEEQLTANPSLKAGLNIALYDILGKKAEMPLFRLLGGYREKIETSVTIGLNPVDVMVAKAKEFMNQGFHCLKVKCGMDPDHDICASFLWYRCNWVHLLPISKKKYSQGNKKQSSYNC